MKRDIITTGDGSTTIHLPEWDEQYHSKHGAIAEAKHVFIQKGLFDLLQDNSFPVLHILEIGFGTGLNAFITYLTALEILQKINYTGIEAYPIGVAEANLMNYPEVLEATTAQTIFEALHDTPWETPESISSDFILTKRKQFFADVEEENSMHLIYFDAFGARVQPELWTVAIFEKMYKALQSKGVLVTYAAKGSVRRAMQEVGFLVERLPGPPGKREMLRATKS